MSRKVQTTHVLTAQDKTKPALRSVQRNFSNTKKGVDALTKSTGMLQKALGPLAVIGSIAGIVNLGKNSLDAADRIQKLGIQLGISTEYLSQIGHTANIAGVSFDATAMAMRKMQKSVADAKDGLATANDAFEKLGISVDDLHKMSPEQVFEAVADGISKMENPLDRTQAAMNIMGRAGADLIPMFEEGAAGIRKYNEEADRLGKTLSQEQADSAAAAKDAMQRLSTATSGLVTALTVGLAPALTTIANGLTTVLGWLNKVAAKFDEWQVSLEGDKLTIAPPDISKMESFRKDVEKEAQAILNNPVLRKLYETPDVGGSLRSRGMGGVKLDKGEIYEQATRNVTARWEAEKKAIQTINQNNPLPAFSSLGDAPYVTPAAQDPTGLRNFAADSFTEDNPADLLMDITTSAISANEQLEILNRVGWELQGTTAILADSMSNLAGGAVDVLAGSFGQLFEAWVSAERPVIMLGRAFKKMAAQVISSLVAMIAKMLIAVALMSILGLTSATGLGKVISNFGGLTGKATGGPVGAGKSYMVGERGPELFTPSQSGFITPNNQVSNTYNSSPTVIVNAQGDIVNDPLKLRRLAEKINDEIGNINKTFYNPSTT